MNRFDYIAYDDLAKEKQAYIKKKFQDIEDVLSGFPKGRPISLALTALEESYMWIGKAIRDEQIARDAEAELEEGRSNS